MAVRIFCNACQNYIRVARVAEFGELKGTEICESCRDRIKGLFDEVEKVTKRGIVKIETTSSKIKADMEESMRRVILKED